MAIRKFVPKVNKFDFYFYETIGGNIIQLVGEAKETFVPKHLSILQVAKIIKRAKLCELLSSIEFTIDSYGLINYYVDTSPDELVRFEYLKNLLAEYEDDEGIEFIQKSLDFFSRYEDELEDLASKKEPEAFHTRHEELEALIDFSMGLHRSVLKLDQEIRKKPDDFCFDELGQPIDPNFEGPLTQFYPNGKIAKEYHFRAGRAHGEGMEYNLDGTKSRLALFDQGQMKKVLKSWDKHGNLFER